MKRRTIGIVVTVVVIGVGGLYALGRQGQTESAQSPSVEALAERSVKAKRGSIAESVSALGTLDPIQSYDLKAKVLEDVAEIAVEERDFVEEGDLLVRMDVTDLDLSVRQARANYLSDKARLDDLMAGATDSEFLRAKTSLRQAEITLREAERALERNQRLHEAGAISEQQLIESRNAAQKARQSYIVAKDEYEQLQEPPDAADVAVAEAELAQAEVQRAIAIENRNNAEVRSPIDGTVIDIPVQVGDTVVDEKTVVATVANLSTMQAVVYINEIDIPRVYAGQRVVIQVDALPGKTLEGSVTEVSLKPEVRDNIVTYEVVATLDETGSSLRPGMTADVEIILESKEDALLLPVGALIVEDGKTSVKRFVDGKIEGVPVEVGLRSETQVEITSGLKEGDQIVLPTPGSMMPGGPAGRPPGPPML